MSSFTVARFVARSVCLAPVALGLLASLSAQTEGWAKGFNHPGLGLASRVFALTVFRGELIAGGIVGRGHGEFLSRGVVRYDPDSRTWGSLGGGLTIRQFNGNALGGDGRAFAVFNNELIVAGNFTHAGNTRANNIARWDGTQYRALGSGIGTATTNVHALAVYRGRLFAAGEFRTAGGVAASHIAEWDGTRWSSLGAGLTWRSTAGFGRALVAASDGLLYVGGQFDMADGVAADNVASFDGTSFRPLGSGTDRQVKAIAEWRGRIYVGGRFDQAGGVPNTLRVAAWDGRSWSALATGIRGTTFREATSLHVHGGALYVGGRFFSAAGVSVQHVARWDGTRFSSIGGVGGTSFVTSAPLVLAMTSFGSQLVVGGEFWRVGGPSDPIKSIVSRSVAAVDTSSAEWQQLGRGAGFAVNATVHEILEWRGATIALGKFSMAGRTPTSGVVAFDGNDWRDLGLPYGQAISATVLGGDLYVGVKLTTRPSGVLRFDGVRWTPVGSTGQASALAVYNNKLYKDGSGQLLQWDGNAWIGVGPRFGGTINVLHVHNGLLYVGGSINASAGISRGIFAFDGVRAMPLGSGVQGRVSAIGSWGTGLAVGGTFLQAGSVPLNTGVARWDGLSWSRLDAGLPRTTTPAEFRVLNGELYAAGGFAVPTGQLGGVSYCIARMRSGVWQIMRDGPIGFASSLHADSRTGHLWAGGTFIESATMPMDRIARLSTRGDWTSVGSALAGVSGDPALAGHGALRAGELVTFVLQNARGASPAVHVLGASRVDFPIFGGVLVPRPDVGIGFLTDAFGTHATSLQVPRSLGAGVDVFLQSWILDAGGPRGLSASNGITARTR